MEGSFRQGFCLARFTSLLPLPILRHVQVSTTSRPILILFDKHSANQPHSGVIIWKYPYHSFPASDLFVEPFCTVSCSQPFAETLWQNHYGHRIVKSLFKPFNCLESQISEISDDPVKQFSGRIYIRRFKPESESGVELILKCLGARIQDVFGEMSLVTLP